MEAPQGDPGLFDAQPPGRHADDGAPVIGGEGEILKAILRGDIPDDERFALKAEAWILQLAYSNDKLLSLSNSRTQVLAHQVESTHRIISALEPRFLLADEVGLGKTIEAGLALKEMIFRRNHRRILIVCPASLVLQWQNELRSKFNEDFIIIDRQELARRRKSAGGRNPWRGAHKVICSLDFVKSKANMELLTDLSWDTIIIDEAHRLRRDSLRSTLAYSAGESLAARTKSLLLLTATPFRGKLEELYYLVYLLDKNLLGPFQTFYNTYCLSNSDLSPLREKISEVIIRRTKKEVGGFTRRMARTIRFELFPQERELYDATTRYVAEEYNRAMQSENRAVGFVMTVFQKLLDSSSRALLSALRNRKLHLEGLLARSDTEMLARFDFEKNLDLAHTAAGDGDDIDERLLLQSLKKTRSELAEEIRTIEGLIVLAEAIPANKKGEKLRELVRALRKKKKKILIFTQFRTTQDYLAEVLSEFTVELFHGSMSRDEKEGAITSFREKADILISTEAGGEGRNLQFCSVLVNYDLPWSPLKIEQRIGRIHRFGQPCDVQIYNFSTAGTVAEKVLQVLERKLKLFEESIGTPDILLGQIEEELNLNAIFMEMMAGLKNRRKLGAEIDEKMDRARRSYEKLSELTVTRKLDFNYDEYYRVTLQERKVSNRRIEEFVNRLRKVDPHVDGKIGRRNRITGLYPLPAGGKGKRQGTFDSQKALENESLEFLAFGNPLVEEFMGRCREDRFGGLTGIRAVKYERYLSGMIFHYLVRFTAASNYQEFVPVAVIPNRGITPGDLDEIERRALLPYTGKDAPPSEYRIDIHRIIAGALDHFEAARERVMVKADALKSRLTDAMASPVKFEIDKLNDAYSKKLKELEEQMERQECQMKWFEKDMKSAITRTKNKIGEVRRDHSAALARYHSYLEPEVSITLINAGILITRP